MARLGNMAGGQETEMPFIFTDSNGKAEPSKRKLIRKHVMLGKNRGKTRNAKLTHQSLPCDLRYHHENPDEFPGPCMKVCYSAITKKVGSDLSFTQFAADVETPLLHDLLKFSFIAKRVMYPLESCIVFHRNNKVDSSWIELWATDAAYMHAAVFASQAYILYTSAKDCPMVARQVVVHHSKALRLLRERISASHIGDKTSDSTVLVVLYLALHAYFMNDHSTAIHHMEGLRNIVDLRGGLIAFSHNTKLVMELLKCDLGIALSNGTITTFFNEQSLDIIMPHELVLPWKDELCPAVSDLRLDTVLTRSWELSKRFCSMINSAVKHKRQLPKETVMNAMAALMYPLLRMSYCNPFSDDEAIRLGLLVFSFHVFLNWQGMKLPNTYLPQTYRNCLINLKSSGTFPAQAFVWLLMVGSLSIFTIDDDPWLLDWLHVSIELCKANTWVELREQLKEFPWIDMLHDKPAQLVFDAAKSRQSAI
ncbi:hypothetical protein BX600DRAFT_471789 [Xylariales sp. PMI_506]|nr:hypothetical protein BX600DRAFT_471789 [Xylariales sp. PMI_506]